jgi:hypothetical protein
MKGQNPRTIKLKESIRERWYSEDYPGAEPRFQIGLLAKDIGIFVVLPVLSIILFKSCESAFSAPKRTSQQVNGKDRSLVDAAKSQIFEFGSNGASSPLSGIAKRSPGSLVKVRLLNSVEIFSNAPVHAQIVDAGLGNNLLGGTLIGDAVADPNFERINISFRFVRDPRRPNVAISIAARALSLDGTLGVAARKREGYFARSVIGAATPATQDAQSKIDAMDIRQMIFKALASGFAQEFAGATQVEKNKAQVLTLRPSTVFFAELTDFFPGAAK